MHLREEALPLGPVKLAQKRGLAFEGLDLSIDFGEKRLLLVGCAASFDAPKSVIGRSVGKRVQLFGQPQLFDAALMKTGTAAAAGEGREEIERRRVGMIKTADGPAKGHPAQLRENSRRNSRRWCWRGSWGRKRSAILCRGCFSSSSPARAKMVSGATAPQTMRLIFCGA